MARTIVFSGIQEHFLAYALSAILAAAAVRTVTSPLVAICFVMLAAVLELGQNLVPGRSPALADFFASTAGALTGIAIWLVIRLAKRRSRSSSRLSRERI
jgi:VanZ family protein